MSEITLDINKTYVSPDDKFLYTFDATHEKSASQLREIAKHQAIAQKRDGIVEAKHEDDSSR